MPDDTPVDLFALADLTTPWCLHTVATLRIAEQMAAGHEDCAAIAAAAGCDATALRGVLRHLVSRGVFEEPEPGRFRLNDAARGLLETGLQIMLDLNGIGGRFAGAWSTLPAYVRTGRPGYAELFGRPFWEDLAAHPQLSESFDALMGPVGHGAPNTDIPLGGGWEAVQHVCDVGGGAGNLLAALLKRYPHLRGTLVDLPQTVVRSAEVFAEAGVRERAEAVAGSFFEPLPSGADVYLLKSVIPDWPDEEAGLILRRCAEAARPEGRVLVLNGIVDQDKPHELSLEAVLLGGRNRSVAAFGDLARQAGLDIVAMSQRANGQLIAECRPVAPAGVASGAE